MFLDLLWRASAMKRTLALVLGLAVLSSGCKSACCPNRADPCPSVFKYPTFQSGAARSHWDEMEGPWTEERWIPSATSVATRDLHDVRCKDSACGHHAGPGECKDGGFCTNKSIVSVSTPSDKWVFSGADGDIKLGLLQDNQGSWQWNKDATGLPAFVTYNSPHRIDIWVITGSRSIVLNACAKARYYP